MAKRVAPNEPTASQSKGRNRDATGIASRGVAFVGGLAINGNVVVRAGSWSENRYHDDLGGGKWEILNETISNHNNRGLAVCGVSASYGNQAHT